MSNVLKDTMQSAVIPIQLQARQSDWRTSLWGISPVMPIHFGIDNLIVLQKDLASTVNNHYVVLADIYGSFTRDLSIEQTQERATYFECYLRDVCGLHATYRKQSDFQVTNEYTSILYAMLASLTVGRARNALPSNIKQASHGDSLFALIAPVMQIADACIINPSVIFADVGQRRIYELAESSRQRDSSSASNTSTLRLPPRRYVPLSHDTQGRPLSQSRSTSRISIHDSPEGIRQKVKKMYAPPPDQPLEQGRVNALLEYFRWSVFPWMTGPLTLPRARGSWLQCLNYPEFENAYSAGYIHPADCKDVLTDFLIKRAAKIAAHLQHAPLAWINHDQLGQSLSKEQQDYGSA